MVGHLLPNLDFREDGSEFWWGVFSLCLSLSLCVCLVSLSRAAECNERSKRATAAATTTTTATTPREKELRRKSLFFLTSVCLKTFSEIPQKETRAALFLSSSPFCLVSALLLLFLLLKKSAFLRRILLLCARPYCILLSKVQETSAKAAHKRLLGDLITWPTFLCESTRNATTRVRLQ